MDSDSVRGIQGSKRQCIHAGNLIEYPPALLLVPILCPASSQALMVQRPPFIDAAQWDRWTEAEQLSMLAALPPQIDPRLDDELPVMVASRTHNADTDGPNGSGPYDNDDGMDGSSVARAAVRHK